MGHLVDMVTRSLFQKLNEAIEFCAKHNIPFTNIIINSNTERFYTIMVPSGSLINLCGYKEKRLPEYIQFSDMFDGTFVCSYSMLESMDGFPKQVGQLDISYSGGLKSIDGAPDVINRDLVAIGTGLSEEQIRDFNEKCMVKGRVLYDYEISNLKRCKYNGAATVSLPRKPLYLPAKTYKFNVYTGTLTIIHGVEEIGELEFAGRLEIKKLEVPDTVVSIGERAFFGCANLSSVQMPDSVKQIGALAFFGSKISESDLPKSASKS